MLISTSEQLLILWCVKTHSFEQAILKSEQLLTRVYYISQFIRL